MPAGDDLRAAVAQFEARCFERARAAVRDPSAISVIAVVRGQASAAAPGSALVGSWWCAGEGERHSVLPNPWDEREAIGLYEALAYELRVAFTARLAHALNEVHMRSHSVAYWDILLGPWLADTVTAILERRLLCLMARAAAPDAVFLVLPATGPPVSMATGLSEYVNEAGNARLLDVVCQALGLPRRGWDGRLAAADSALPEPSPLRKLRSRRATILDAGSSAIARLLMRGRRGRRVLLLGNIGFSAAQPLLLARRVPGLRCTDIRPWDALDAAELPDMRAAIAKSVDAGAETGAAGTIAHVLPRLLPRTVLEGYRELEKESRRLYGDPCSVVVGAYHANEPANDFLGRCHEHATGMAFAQHGGAYRQFAVNPVERLEMRDDATFLSWGWCGPGARALPNPRLSRLRDTLLGGDTVTLVEVVYYLTVARFASVPLADQVLGPRRLAADFADAIRSEEVKRALALKRYRAGYAAAVPSDERLDRLDTQRFASHRATDWMRRSRIAVVTYPDTTFIEAMVIGVPTIGLWDPKVWELRDDAAEPFARLVELGVIQSDPAAAASLVEDVYARATAWWKQREIQEAREAFLRRFGRTGDWAAPWSAFLNELAG